MPLETTTTGIVSRRFGWRPASSSRPKSWQKSYEMGAEQVHALSGVDLDDSQRRIPGDYGAFGFRQVHNHEYVGLPGHTNLGQLRIQRQECRQVSDVPTTNSPASATVRSGSSFRPSTCCRAPTR